MNKREAKKFVCRAAGMALGEVEFILGQDGKPLSPDDLDRVEAARGDLVTELIHRSFPAEIHRKVQEFLFGGQEKGDG